MYGRAICMSCSTLIPLSGGLVMQPATPPPPQPHLNPPSLPEGPHLNKNIRKKFEYVWYSNLVACGDQQNCPLSVGILFFSHLQIPSHVDGF